MDVQKVDGDLATPEASGWAQAESERVALAPIPVDAQPTEYIRAKWADTPYGTVDGVDVAAATDGASLFVRLEWADSETENGEFPDAAAVYFPADGHSPVETTGTGDHPVDLWYWQDNLAAPKRLSGRGPGVFAPADGPSPDGGVAASAALAGGRWSLVLSGPIPSDGRVGVAVWNGSNEERAGLGAVTPEWVALALP